MRDGRLNICKKCKLEYQRNRPKEKIAAIEKKRNLKPDRKRHLASNLKRWRRENPAKVRLQVDKKKYVARNVVNNAVRDGRLQKSCCCKRCGSEKKIQAHHGDYAKPLDVVWLCEKCHNEIQWSDHEEKKQKNAK